MEIHELTRRQKIDEGILDDVKAGVTKAATNITKGVKNVASDLTPDALKIAHRSAQIGMQGKKSTLGKIGGALQGLTSGEAERQATQDVYAKQAAELLKPAQERLAKLKDEQKQRAAAYADQRAQQAWEEFASKHKGVLLQPGETLTVINPVKGTNEKYHKKNGVWWNDDDKKVTNPSSIAHLEKIADSGGGKVTKDEPAPVKEGALAQRAQQRNTPTKPEPKVAQVTPPTAPDPTAPTVQSTATDTNKMAQEIYQSALKAVGTQQDVITADPETSQEITTLAKDTANTRNNPPEFKKKFIKTIKTAIGVLAKKASAPSAQTQPQAQQSQSQEANPEEARAKVKAALNAGTMGYPGKLIGSIRQSMGTQVARSTGNANVDELLRQLGVRIV